MPVLTHLRVTVVGRGRRVVRGVLRWVVKHFGEVEFIGTKAMLQRKAAVVIGCRGGGLWSRPRTIGRRALRAAERQRQAELALNEDPELAALIAEFDGRLVEGSIRPR